MKLFLLEDLKGKGKAGDFIEVKGGYAQFLIRAGKALDYDKNKQEVDRLIERKLDNENDMLMVAYHLKDDLAAANITFTSRLSPKGGLINEITKNDIISKLPENLRNLIDKKMLQMNSNISAVGIYDVPVKLHKQVTGNIRVIVRREE